MNRRHLLGALLALSLWGCDQGSPRFNHTDLSAGMLFPTANLLDEHGRPRNFAEFRGKILLIYFGYTSCPDLCPGALGKYADLFQHMPAGDAKRLQLLFITIDPERDTPERTAAYVRWFHPDFLGLSGNEQQIAAVSRQFKVIYSKKTLDSGMGYVLDHTTNTYLLDASGQLRLVIPDDAPIEAIRADIMRLLAEKSAAAG